MYFVVYYNDYIELGKYVAGAEIINAETVEKQNILKILKQVVDKKFEGDEFLDGRIRIVAISDPFIDKADAENYLKKYPVQVKPISFSIQWHFTKTCNQKCVQCYLRSEQFEGMYDKPELSISEIYSIIDRFYAFCDNIDANPVFVLTGGHPLLSDKLEKMLSYIDNEYRKKGRLSTVFLLGNPQFLQDNLEMLELHNVDSYQISIDGLEKMHDEWRGTGSFSSSLDAIELLNNSTISLKIMATLSKKNAEDIIELYKLLCEKGAPFFAYSRLVPNCSERSSNYFDDCFTPEEYYEFQERMYETIIEMKSRGYKTEFIFKDHLWKPFLIEKGIWGLDERYGAERDLSLIYDGCHINQDSLCIGTDGSVFACMKTRSLLGNITQQSFEEIYASDVAEAFRNYDKYEKCSKCKYKQFCRGCHAVSYGTYGDFYKADPQCWVRV